MEPLFYPIPRTHPKRCVYQAASGKSKELVVHKSCEHRAHNRLQDKNSSGARCTSARITQSGSSSMSVTGSVVAARTVGSSSTVTLALAHGLMPMCFV